VEMGVEPYLIASSLLAVIAQRLVRVICSNCKVEATPAEAGLERLGDAGKEVPAAFIGKGCTLCNSTGYRGRTGVFELLEITPSIIELIAHSADPEALRKQALEERMRPMFQDSLRKVAAGMTTVDEFVGKLMINERGTYWVNGILIEAMEAGDWLLIDEINACLPEIAFCLHSLLDDDRMIVLSEYDGRIVRPHPNFRLLASMNPHEDRRYGGTKPLNEALLDRFPVTIRMEYLPFDGEVEVVTRQSGNEDRALVERMVRVAHDVREAMRNEKVFCTFSTRRLIDWARMATQFDPLEAAASTVSSKVNAFDAKVIEDILDNHF